MLRILSWNSNTGFEKMPSQDLPTPPPSCANLSGKRKRSLDTSSIPGGEAVMNMIKDGLKHASCLPSPTAPSASSHAKQNSECTRSHLASPVPDCTNDARTEVDSKVSSPARLRSKEESQLATMRQTISSQLSLDILMKHKELRLIDQEIAKCQVALEQLRRCTEIPYPATQTPSEQVSTGQGSALRKPGEKHPARSPAAWGVTEGPYTRHYSKWLLQDPHFDGGEAEAPSLSAASAHGRSTRGHYQDFAAMVGKTSRSNRALHQGLPPDYAAPKQKPTGPMILKRKSDGRMVKLVCPDCGRFDFGSAQGFINHCRIGHQRNFASHDAAAEGCGDPIEPGEVESIKGPEEAAPSPVVTPTVAATPVTPVIFSTPISAVHSCIHPLIRSAHFTSKDRIAQPLVPGGFVPKSKRKSSQAHNTVIQQNYCAHTPNLSSYLRTQGSNLNLQDAVEEAKRRDDLPEQYYDDLDMEDSPLPTPTGNSRHPHKAGKKLSAKSASSSEGVRKPSFSQARGRVGTSFSNVVTPAEEMSYQHFMPLIPSPTNESTQAPSLIDDDEEMEPQSPPSSDELDDSDVHFHIRDDEHSEETTELRGHELPPAPTPCTPTAPRQPAMTSPFTRPLSSRDNKHTFIAERPDEQNDKKRRKLGQ